MVYAYGQKPDGQTEYRVSKEIFWRCLKAYQWFSGRNTELWKSIILRNRHWGYWSDFAKSVVISHICLFCAENLYKPYKYRILQLIGEKIWIIKLNSMMEHTEIVESLEEWKREIKAWKILTVRIYIFWEVKCMYDICFFVGIFACAVFITMNIFCKIFPKRYNELLTEIYRLFQNKNKEWLVWVIYNIAVGRSYFYEGKC